MASTRITNHKQYILSLLQNQAGNVDGFDAARFYETAEEATGLTKQTLEQILKEHTGQIWKDKGRIYVITDALLVSETSKAYRPKDTRQGDGISNGMKTHWDWKKSSRKES